MPVRIYDLAKKLGLESKELLTVAKELGISGARVASSSLDKITAEYLEEQVVARRPAGSSVPQSTVTSEVDPALSHEAHARAVIEPVIEVIKETPASEPEPIVLVAPAVLREAHTAPVLVESPAPTPQFSPPVLVPDQTAAAVPPATLGAEAARPVTAVPSVAAPAPTTATPPPIAPPAPPQAPRLGDKVGFIQLPTSGRSGRGNERPPTPPPAPPPRGNLPPRPGMDRGRVQTGGYQQNRPGMGNRPQGGYGGYRQGGGYQQSRPNPQAASGGQQSGVSVEGPTITIKPPIIVRELAEKMGIKPFRLIADLIDLKVMATVNQAIDETIAQRVAAKHGFRFEVEKRKTGTGVTAPKQELKLDQEDKAEDLRPRAPVVTIMGHVDHGKTSLLDMIRKADVAAGEAGGITQHIGAYTISVPHPERPSEMAQITFLDTPGHAAFSSMRARGANVTDIVILVVAANDGVMPQTLEALSHAQAAKAPILVAVNKSDHPNANPMRVRQQLQEKGLVPDEWGGTNLFVDVSALTGQGVPKLLEMILFQADLLELKANPNRLAKGNVIESGLEPGGPTATVLVRKGTLKLGEAVICGPFWGRVRALINEEGKRLKEAGPSVAVRVLGLNGVPEAGLEFSAIEDEKAAREVAEQRAKRTIAP